MNVGKSFLMGKKGCLSLKIYYMFAVLRTFGVELLRIRNNWNGSWTISQIEKNVGRTFGWDSGSKIGSSK